MPIILFNLTSADNIESFKSSIKRYSTDTYDNLLPLNRIIIEEFNIESFEVVLHKLRSSIWWNNNGHFLIKNTQTINSCKSAAFFLKKIWEFNILSVVFLCHDLELGILLYTFNPYSVLATRFWTPTASYTQVNGFPLTLFRNTYNPSGKNIFLLLCHKFSDKILTYIVVY